LREVDVYTKNPGLEPWILGDYEKEKF